MFNSPTRKGFSIFSRVISKKRIEDVGAPIDAKYVVTELNDKLTAEVLFATAFATEDIGNLSNKSHESLSDLGINDHIQIDAHISLVNEHIDWTGASAGTIDPTNFTALQNLVEDITPQLGGELDCQAHSIGGQLQQYTGDGTTTIVFNNGQMIQFTFGAQNDTWTTTAPNEPGVFTLIIIQDSVGGRLLTLPSNWGFAGGTQPTLSTAANAKDFFSVVYDGTDFTMGKFALDRS